MMKGNHGPCANKNSCKTLIGAYKVHGRMHLSRSLAILKLEIGPGDVYDIVYTAS